MERTIRLLALLAAALLLSSARADAQCDSCGSGGGNMLAAPACAGPMFGTSPGCCECNPTPCDNAWEGFCQEKVFWKQLWHNIGTGAYVHSHRANRATCDSGVAATPMNQSLPFVPTRYREQQGTTISPGKPTADVPSPTPKPGSSAPQNKPAPTPPAPPERLPAVEPAEEPPAGAEPGLRLEIPAEPSANPTSRAPSPGGATSTAPQRLPAIEGGSRAGTTSTNADGSVPMHEKNWGVPFFGN